MILKWLTVIVAVFFCLLVLAIKGPDTAFIIGSFLWLAFMMDRTDDRSAALEQRIATLESQMTGVMVDQHGAREN